MKNIYKDKLITVFTFVNPYKTPYVGMEFNVGEDSDPKYRGLPDTKENRLKLAKMFREIAKRLVK